MTYRLQSDRIFITRSFCLIIAQRQSKEVAKNRRALLEIASWYFEQHALNLLGNRFVRSMSRCLAATYEECHTIPVIQTIPYRLIVSSCVVHDVVGRC